MKDQPFSASSIPLVLALALPWLNPFTFGPTHPMVQLLTAWFGGALWCLLNASEDANPASRVGQVGLAWCLAACASALIGLVQYLGFSEPLSPWVNYVEAGQAYANLRQRNQQATLLAIGLCALLWWRAQGAPVQSPLARYALNLVATLLAVAAAATGSRTGMLQLLLLMGLCLLWKRGRSTLLLVLLAYGAAAYALPRIAGLDPLHSGILGRLGEETAPCASRLILWSNTLDLIAQLPWTGWGWGELGYAHFMHLYSGARFCEIMGNAHNLPLHLAVELGLPVALLACLGVAWLLLRAKPWREADASRQMAWGVLAVMGLHSLLEYPLWYGPFQIAALLALWILWQGAPARQGLRPLGAVAAPVQSHAPSLLACAVLLVCSYASWDYWRISQIYLGEPQRAPLYRDDTLEKIRNSWLFADQVKFAELGVTTLSRENAPQIYGLALQMLHFSPEPSVVAKAIESARLLGQDAVAEALQQRFKAAYPQDYAAWQASLGPSGRDKTP